VDLTTCNTESLFASAIAVTNKKYVLSVTGILGVIISIIIITIIKEGDLSDA